MELLLRITHKHPVVATMHVESSQRGDVIACCPDGWKWSKAERENPDWIIISCPITEIEKHALLEAAHSNEPKWRRRVGVNPDGLTSGMVISRDDLMGRLF